MIYLSLSSGSDSKEIDRLRTNLFSPFLGSLENSVVEVSPQQPDRVTEHTPEHPRSGHGPLFSVCGGQLVNYCSVRESTLSNEAGANMLIPAVYLGGPLPESPLPTAVVV